MKELVTREIARQIITEDTNHYGRVYVSEDILRAAFPPVPYDEGIMALAYSLAGKDPPAPYPTFEQQVEKFCEENDFEFLMLHHRREGVFTKLLGEPYYEKEFTEPFPTEAAGGDPTVSVKLPPYRIIKKYRPYRKNRA